MAIDPDDWQCRADEVAGDAQMIRYLASWIESERPEGMTEAGQAAVVFRLQLSANRLERWAHELDMRDKADLPQRDT